MILLQQLQQLMKKTPQPRQLCRNHVSLVLLPMTMFQLSNPFTAVVLNGRAERGGKPAPSGRRQSRPNFPGALVLLCSVLIFV